MMSKIVARDISGVIPNVQQTKWNHSESGHGKDISDGVGGTVKRTADKLLKLGLDITNAATFVSRSQIDVQKHL